MKYLAAALFLSLIPACATAPETSEDQAWVKCNAIADRAVRSNCITVALADAKADERTAKREEQESFESGAKAIENKAGVEQALGAPTDQTGTTIVREPFE